MFIYKFHLVAVGLFTKCHRECMAGQSVTESKNLVLYSSTRGPCESEILKIHQVKLICKDRWRTQDAKTWTTMPSVPQSLEYYKLVFTPPKQSSTDSLSLIFTEPHSGKINI